MVLLMKFYIQVQEVALRSMPDIVVATPGRIIDHLRNSLSVGLEDLAVVILDEADRLLELGFSAEIQELVTVELWFCWFLFALAFVVVFIIQILELTLRVFVFLCVVFIPDALCLIIIADSYVS
jgi:hypothetical protein